MVYFTSDLHFHHSKPFLYEPRGFSDFRDHDATLIHNWNSFITDEDIVYILGDIMLEDNEYGMKCLCALNGTLCIIRGNHDTNTRWSLYQEHFPKIICLNYVEMIKYGKWNFYVSHYPTKTDNYDDTKSLKTKVWNLCGHTHTNDKYLEMRNGISSYHVEMDAHDMKPISIEDIISDIKAYRGV